ncbi:uncharacterized protein LOC126893570 isoform X1 [Daktulosphaira vitifoliae]|uniref:uncharacterized protein LOC126893570 isoform X1 n=2 Tax=Daktulosphaira vitifoliae TaxID=58002 RepID=UPI0021A98786|nr:uncharacterized protein LOC126893570 isoform X1 [Daktulosphaira vitifoliae]XP_050519858.1 uncharacterized protein LOC126893570 isoform X1 [Daktulosphaira vitifoliae]XP_050519859.1 uncharacterized protein LOC126893570 isoform X1 [Daktulosphaira vitifoliae]XP_050519860.1 uncharacterized protein LOC126893570 isoform X1 [Daktulosphaira vitifoliae]
MTTNTTRINSIGAQRWIYNLIVSSAFAINTNCQYNDFVRHISYFGSFNWFLVSLGSATILLTEVNISIGMILELLVYIIIGLVQSLIILMLLIQKKKITFTYTSIQNTFIKWSLIRKVDPNISYNRNTKVIYIVIITYLIVIATFFTGPLLALKYDQDNLPIDHHSHWIVYWPKIFNVGDSYIYYYILYSLQVISSFYLSFSTFLYNLYLVIYLSEIKHQFKLIEVGLQRTFCFKENKTFQEYFIECVCQHQEILKSLDEFKVYFKYILFGEIVSAQFIFSIIIFCMIKVDASTGYVLKCGAILSYWLIIYIFQCDYGDDIISMHKSIAFNLYSEEYYNLSNENKKMVIIMLQRTQKELLLNSAIISNQVASKSTLLDMLKFIYKFLNFLLKF